MAERRLQRYFRLNLVLLVAGGLALGLGASSQLGVHRLAGPLIRLGPEPAATPGGQDGVEYWQARYLEAVAWGSQLQERLYLQQADLRNLHGGLELVHGEPDQVVLARVVRWRDLSDLRQAVLLDRGLEAGVREGMPVTCLGWLVGVTARVTPATSWVVLLEDTSFRCEVVIGGPMTAAHEPQGMEVGRPRGIYNGLGGLGGCGEIRHIPATGRQRAGPEIAPGAVVYTAPHGQLPGGLPLGVISSVQGTRKGLFLELRVQPVVDLHLMERVAVLKEGPVPGSWEAAPLQAREGGGRR
jgi:cell shape-determining protein MreC